MPKPQPSRYLFVTAVALCIITVITNISLFASTSLQLGDSTGSAGSSITVPLRLFTSEVVSAAQIDLVADPGIATIAGVSGSSAGADHIVDSEVLENGSTRVVVYSNSNEFLFSEVLVDVNVVLKTNVVENERSLRVESVKLADDGADVVDGRLVPNAVFQGPDSSVVYQMGDQVGGTATAYGTSAEIDRVEFLVGGWSMAKDFDPPYEMNFPIEYFGNITITARAYDEEGNWYDSGGATYQIDFPPTLQAWLDVFFSSVEKADPDIGGLLADLDLDGNSTLLEYAMGLHPRRGDGPRESGFFQDPQTGLYHFGYIRPVGVEGLIYTFQVSPNLENWQAADGIVSTEIVSINNYWEEVRFTLDDLQEPREFGRVLIESTP